MKNLQGTDDSGHILVKSTLCLGLLLCQGDDYNKAEFFFEILNPDYQNQSRIYAGDRDIKPVFTTIAEIAAGLIVSEALKADAE